MTHAFSKKSLEHLKDVHPDLQRLAHRALLLSPIDFGVIDGIRTVNEQKKLFESGATKTMNSRHLTGHAIDVAAFVDGKIRWDWPLYDAIAVAFKAASRELNIPIVWGGDWTTFKDGPHYELDRKFYP